MRSKQDETFEAAADHRSITSAEVCSLLLLAVPSLQEFYAKLTGLKWLHSVATGLELWLTPEVLSSSVTITNAKGVTANSMAE